MSFCFKYIALVEEMSLSLDEEEINERFDKCDDNLEITLIVPSKSELKSSLFYLWFFSLVQMISMHIMNAFVFDVLFISNHKIFD